MRKGDVFVKRGKISVAVALSMVMGVSVLSGCSVGSSSNGSEVTTEVTSGSKKSDSENQGNEIYGVVSSISSDSITIKVGTLNAQSKPDNKNQSSNDSSEKNSANNSSTESEKDKDTNSTESTKKSSSEAPAEKSMITTTGEKKTITLTSSTKVSQEMPGNPPQGDGQNNGQQPQPSQQNNTSANGENSSQNGSQEQPPAKPEKNDQSSSDGSSSEEKAADNNSSSGADSESQSKELSVSDVKENDEVCIILDDDGNAEEIRLLSGGGPDGQNGGVPQGGNGQSAPTSYTSVTKYSKDKTTKGKSYSSTGTDENAVHVTDGARVTLKDAIISRESEESQGGDRSSFYGIGAAVLTTDGTSYISGNKITTNAKGGAGIFSYGDGITYVSDTTISTKKDTSGGLHVAGGGKLYAWNVTATTQGESSAAIRSDRGGGTMVIDGGTYTSNGTGSPAVYSTADIAIRNAKLTANNSESVCIEGVNSLRLFDCDLTGNMKKDSQNDCTWNVILYQSMSGDSEDGNSTFEMNGGTLTAKNGGMFYTTNTESTIRLSNVNITYAKNNEFFLKCTGNSNKRGWGTSGANGADCSFTADNQQMEGDVIWDSISQLDFYMSNGSTLKGAVADDESNAGSGGNGYCNFYIEKGSTWTVTGNSTLTNLYNAGTIVDKDGKKVTIKGTDGTIYVKGDSAYAVTVSSYSTKADMSGMTESTVWKDYKVEKDSEL